MYAGRWVHLAGCESHTAAGSQTSSLSEGLSERRLRWCCWTAPTRGAVRNRPQLTRQQEVWLWIVSVWQRVCVCVFLLYVCVCVCVCVCVLPTINFHQAGFLSYMNKYAKHNPELLISRTGMDLKKYIVRLYWLIYSDDLIILVLGKSVCLTFLLCSFTLF